MNTGPTTVDAIDRPRRLSLIIPAFNEEAVIAQSLREAVEALEHVAHEFEIIVVDDGSTDRTSAIAQQFAADDSRIQVVRQPANQGYGAALRAGFRASRFELVAFTDADCQFHLDDLEYMLPMTKRYDIVSGYRLNRQDTGLRKLLSWGYNTLIQFFLGSTSRDVDCALKVFHREQLESIAPHSDRYFANTEMALMASRTGLRTVEVGVRHRPRAAGRSKVRWNDVPRTLAELLPFWWQEVMFDSQEPSAEKTTSAALYWGALVLLLVLASALLFPKLSFPLIEPDEGRYAEIPREMLITGDWIVPKFHGEPYLDKPPLFYWLCAVSYSVFGVHDWAARLVPAISGLLTIAVTFAFGARMLGQRGAFLGTMVLSLSFGFLCCSRFLVMDSLLTLLVTTSLFAAWESFRTPRWNWPCWLLSALCCGLGVMTKGPVAILLLVPPVLAFSWLNGHMNRLTLARWAAFAAIVLATAVPWFALLMSKRPEFAAYFFWDHHIARFLTNAHHPQPFWYFAPVAFVGTMPWGLLLFPLCGFLFRRGEALRKKRPPALGFLLLSVGWCVAFFSLSKGKLPPYVLPAAPALSLMLGCLIDRMYSPFALRHSIQADASFRLFRLGTQLVCLAGCCIGPVAAALGLMDWRHAFTESCLWGAGLAATLFAMRVPASRMAWSVFCTGAFAVALVTIQELLPAWAVRHQVADEIGPLNDELTDAETPVAIVEGRWGSVPFYLDREDIVLISNLDDPDLADFCEDAGISLVYLNHNYTVDELDRALPEDCDCERLYGSPLTTIIRVASADQKPISASRSPVTVNPTVEFSQKVLPAVLEVPSDSVVR